MTVKKIPPVTVSFSGTFNLNSMYKYVIEWASNQNYDFHEPKYFHKSGAELEIVWLLQKDVTDYINYRLDIKIKTWKMNQYQEGNQTLNDGDISIVISGQVNGEWQGRFNEGFWKKLNKMFNNLKESELQQHEGVVYGQIYSLAEMFKSNCIQ